MTGLKTSYLTDQKRYYPNNKSLAKWSLYAMILYFIFQPFNDWLHTIVFIGSFIDMIWIVVLLGFSLMFYLSGPIKIAVPLELKIMIVWLYYMIISFLLDKIITGPSADLFLSDLGDIRWFFQSVPIFILTIFRGLNKREINSILLAIVLVMPFSIYSAYQLFDITTIEELQNHASLGYGINYNTYVPYTTFSLFASAYLFIESKNIFIKILILNIFGFILSFIFINPSRQSFLFVLLGTMVYLVLTKGYSGILLSLLGVLGLSFVLTDLGMTERVMSRFFSKQLMETNRPEAMLKGLSEMNGIYEWCFGKGLHISLTDGVNPHSNYVFSIMRTGLIGLALMFTPFVGAQLKLILGFIKFKNNTWYDKNYTSFISISVLFVLFHSFFGYPHLDSLNGPIVWFVFALWVNYNNDQRQKIFRGLVPQQIALTTSAQ